MLDQQPILFIIVAFAALSFLLYEIGFRFGRWWQERTPDKEEQAPAGVIVGAILGLMAFLLAVTMGMASDRFDTRRSIVLQEANVIGTTYLRADYLPQPYQDQVKGILAEYAPLRVLSASDLADIGARIVRSDELLDQLWDVSTAAVTEAGSSDVLALYVESVNDLIDTNTQRITAGIYARVPDTILLLLIGGTILSLGMVGYSAGLAGKRSLITATVLIVALGAVLMLVVDLDRSRDGFLQVSQQPIIDVVEELGIPGGG